MSSKEKPIAKKKFQLIATADEIAKFWGEMNFFLQEAGVSMTEQSNLRLALSEVLTNAVRHSYEGQPGPVHVNFFSYKDRLEFWIRDFGIPFDLTKVPNPDIPPTKPGGLGVFFVKQLMDEVLPLETSEGNYMKLVKYKTTKGR